MLNKKQTELILKEAFKDCYDFWKSEGKETSHALAIALDEIREVDVNPFNPNGKKLNLAAKAEFIKQMELDLGI